MIGHCKPDEISLKSFFVGPQAENADVLYSEIKMVLDFWIDWRKKYYPNDGMAISKADQSHPEFKKKINVMRGHTRLLLELFSKEIPKFSPRYLGHMFSEISMPALIGHIIALLHNPNNVSNESSWVGVEIENKAIQKLCQMVGYPKNSLGHFTSGGTLANFEAILRAKSKIINQVLVHGELKTQFNDACYLKPSVDQLSKKIPYGLGDIDLYRYIKGKFKIDFNGFTIIVPDSQHYSWTKGCSLFGVGINNLTKVSLNKYGQICHRELQQKIDRCLMQKKPILCITSVCGTTELGTIDPINKVHAVLEKYERNYGYNFWHHVDAAYGGFFACLKGNPLFEDQTKNALAALRHSTSMTIDPHKLGYVPYASGAFICQNRADYYAHEVSAPYVNFELEKDPGPYTIEGSRPATGAVALYMTSECIGLDKKGYGKILERTIRASMKLKNGLKKSKASLLLVETVGTNIVCFAVGSKGDQLSIVNNNTKSLLEKILAPRPAPDKNAFFVSKTILGENYKNLITHFCSSHGLKKDCQDLHLVRLTVMNPFVISVNSKTDYLSDFIKYIQLNISEYD